MNKLKKIFKVIFAGLLLYALFGVGVFFYSVLWMRPHADRALNEFKKSVVEGTRIETVKATASKVGADEYHSYTLSPPEDGATEEVAVYFFRFPGGLARDVCRIKFKNGAAISIKYYFRG